MMRLAWGSLSSDFGIIETKHAEMNIRFLKNVMCYFPCVLKEVYHYWTYVLTFSKGLKQMEVNNPLPQSMKESGGCL